MDETGMICDICGQEGARVRHVTRTYGQGQNLLVIEKIPAIRCPRCGETYFTAETIHRIEEIKIHRKKRAQKMPVAVAEFA
jgi:YgiT-type zinc finger domain-containing protein